MYDTRAFDCSDVEAEFFNAPRVSLSEAKDSPRKKRLTVEGTVESVRSFMSIWGFRLRHCSYFSVINSVWFAYLSFSCNLFHKEYFDV